MHTRALVRLSTTLLGLCLSVAKLQAQSIEPRELQPTLSEQTSESEGNAPSVAIRPLQLSLSDSMQIATSTRLAEQIASPYRPHSGHALLWSILPGGGQIYNRKYWKVPIVWGALATCAYFIGFNSRLYNEYHTAWRDLMSSDPQSNTAWLAFAPPGAKPEDYARYDYLKQTLQRGNDYYRRYRDLSIVLMIGVYGLSMLDAYVDAELFTFDISPDLSMRISPTFTPQIPHVSSYQMGVACSLTF